MLLSINIAISTIIDLHAQLMLFRLCQSKMILISFQVEDFISFEFYFFL